MLSVMKEILNPPRAVKSQLHCHERWVKVRWLTGVHGCDKTFHNQDRKCVKPRESIHDLADGRQLGYHVQKHSHQCQKTQPQSGDDSISLAHPLGEDEALWALLADDGAQVGKNQQRKGRGQGVDDHALHARDGGQLRV